MRPVSNPRIIKPRRRPSIQAPTRDPANDAIARKYTCATCTVTYEVPRGQRAKCPVCVAEAERDQLRQALLEAKSILERQTNELNQLRPQLDLVIAMRDAVEILGSEDRAFLKSVAYRHRAGEVISLKVITTTQTGRGGSIKRRPTGLLAVYATGNEPHQCTSLGGLAMAQYIRNSLASVGPITTMHHVMLAMSDQLTPAGGGP